MGKLNEMQKSIFQHIVLFGEPKTGKSTLAGKLSEKFKIIWISLDNGHGVLFKLPHAWKENIEVINIHENPSVPVAYDTVKKLFECKPVKVCQTHGVVSCSVCMAAKKPFDEYNFGSLSPDTIVVIDHMTQLSESLLRQIKIKDPEDEKASFNDYGSQGLLMARLLTRIQHAQFHVIALAQPLEVELEDKKKKLVPWIGTRNFSATVSNYFDSMVYVEVMNKAHKAGSSTTYSMTAQTGSRDDVAIETLKEPSLLPFFNQELLQEAAAKKAAADASNASVVLAAAKNSVAAGSTGSVVNAVGAVAAKPEPAKVPVATTTATAPAPVSAVPVTVINQQPAVTTVVPVAETAAAKVPATDSANKAKELLARFGKK